MRVRRAAGAAVLFSLVGLATVLRAQAPKARAITADEAKNHIGETATVCGKVASTKYAVWNRGQPTFINLDEPYPRQVFTVLVWGSDRAKFGRPEEIYRGKSVCVTGKITKFRGVPEVIASEPGQIKVQAKDDARE